MPSRHATKKGKLNGAARKELNLSVSTAVIEKTVLGTNEDTVFGRVTKMWGNGHCQVLAVHGKIRVQLHKVRIPKNRLGKKGSTPITLNSVVSIFVGREFEPTKVRDADAFDITAVLDDKQVRTLIKSSLAPAWFLKTADEISSTEEVTAVEEEGFEWDTSADEASGDDAVVEFAAQAALSRLQKGRDAGHLGDALTKKQLREVKKITAKASAGKKLTSETSRPVDEDESEENEDAELSAAQLAFLAAKQETRATDDSKWAALGESRSATKDAWIDRI